jgi:hypothetical protein
MVRLTLSDRHQVADRDRPGADSDEPVVDAAMMAVRRGDRAEARQWLAQEGDHRDP